MGVLQHQAPGKEGRIGRMESRTILGNLANKQLPAKQLSMTSWLALRGANNKENVRGQITKSSATSTKKVNLAGKIAKRTPIRLKSIKDDKSLKSPEVCVGDQCMDIEVCDDNTTVALPEGVIDIDSEHGDDSHLWGEYSPEIYAYLRHLESANLIKDDYLRGCSITSKMRSLLIDWLVSVHQQFELLPETLYRSVNILDRYLQLEGKNTQKDQLQLVGVVAMLLACKIEEIYLPAIDDFVYSTDNAYTEDELKVMELKMMSVLNFNLTCPIPLNFLRRYSRAGDVDVLEHNVSKYILELCLMDYSQLSIPASMSSAAALHLSLILLEPNSSSVWNPSLEYYSGYSSASLMPLVRRMAAVLVNAESHRLQAVRTKYCSRKFRKVALRQELSEQFITNRVPLE